MATYSSSTATRLPLSNINHKQPISGERVSISSSRNNRKKSNKAFTIFADETATIDNITGITAYRDFVNSQKIHKLVARYTQSHEMNYARKVVEWALPYAKEVDECRTRLGHDLGEEYESFLKWFMINLAQLCGGDDLVDNMIQAIDIETLELVIKEIVMERERLGLRERGLELGQMAITELDTEATASVWFLCGYYDSHGGSFDQIRGDGYYLRKQMAWATLMKRHVGLNMATEEGLSVEELNAWDNEVSRRLVEDGVDVGFLEDSRRSVEGIMERNEEVMGGYMDEENEATGI